MPYKPKNPDPELAAFSVVSKVLSPLPQDVRDRVLRYLQDRYCSKR